MIATKRYTKVALPLGEGTFGHVVYATKAAPDPRTPEEVAVKTLKDTYSSWSEVRSLREVEANRKLGNHPNIVKCYDVSFSTSSGRAEFVFEYMPGGTLCEMLHHCKEPLHELHIQCLLRQILQGLAHVHRCGYVHRDIKPENLLLSRDWQTCKIADFSLARKQTSTMANHVDNCLLSNPTSYVSTRWYRAPEMLLKDPAYGTPVDVWAVGCVMVELFEPRPLFPGCNEVDQLCQIFSFLGVPKGATYPKGVILAQNLGLQLSSWSSSAGTIFDIPSSHSQSITPPDGKGRPRQAHSRSLIPRLWRLAETGESPHALSLLLQLIDLNPQTRRTAEGALGYDYFLPCAQDSRQRPRYECPNLREHQSPFKSEQQELRLRKGLVKNVQQCRAVQPLPENSLDRLFSEDTIY